ncbi:MAG: hypothetical protein ACR2MP_21680, partial [Streptosporangiaceae bacterium]
LRGGRFRSRGRLARLTPLAAAAAVITVLAVAALAGTVAVAHGRAGHGTAARHHQESLLAQLPAYYVALGRADSSRPSLGRLDQPRYAQVRATATGKVLATVRPPRPYDTFSEVSAAADVHTFVLVASRWRKKSLGTGAEWITTANQFFRLRIDPAAGTARLTALSIPQASFRNGEGFAVSPDGTKLAVAQRLSMVAPANPEIQVYDLATGTRKAWTWPGGGAVTNNAGGQGQVLSWARDGTLAFQQWAGNSIEVRLLDTNGPGGSLKTDSRLAVDWAGDAESFRFSHGRAANVISGYSALLTLDGTKIICATTTETKHPLTSVLSFTEFSARTGRVVRQLGSWTITGLYPGQTQDVLWANPSGSALIVMAHRPGVVPVPFHHGDSADYSLVISAVSQNKFIPLTGTPAGNGLDPWPTW